jgi:hypothetical protein
MGFRSYEQTTLYNSKKWEIPFAWSEKPTKSWQKKRAPKATKPSDCLQQSPEHQHILAVLKIRNVPLYWLGKNGIPHSWCDCPQYG